MITYSGINAFKETLRNKSFFDSISFIINEPNKILSLLKDIKIQAVYVNSKKELKISDNAGTGDIVIDCGVALGSDTTLPGG